GSALERDVAAEQTREPLADGEAEAGAAAPIPARVQADEFPEDRLLLVFGDAGTRVGNGDGDPRAWAGGARIRLTGLHRHGDAAVLRVLHRVHHQVREDLSDAVHVGV